MSVEVGVRPITDVARELGLNHRADTSCPYAPCGPQPFASDCKLSLRTSIIQPICSNLTTPPKT